MQRILLAVALLLCGVAFVVALAFLVGVLRGAVGDARILAGVSPWLLLVYPAYWIVGWTFGRWVD